MIVVSDTSPITYLLQINQIHLLQQLFQTVAIPVRVYEELCELEEQKIWLTNGNVHWISVKEVGNKEWVKQLNIVLDRGESEAIAFGKGIERRCDFD